METRTRRQALRDGLLVIAGAIGIGSVARSVVQGPSLSIPSRGELTLFGRGIRAEGVPFGTRPKAGDRLTLSGELLATPSGGVLGEFHGTRTLVGEVLDDGVTAIEMHTFSLKDGTIMGMGTADGSDSATTFAIVGGTGRFAGASGTYLAKTGEEQAEFRMTLTGGTIDGR